MKISKCRLIVKYYSKDKSTFNFVKCYTFSHFQIKLKFKNSPQNCCLIFPLAFPVISKSKVPLYAPQTPLYFSLQEFTFISSRGFLKLVIPGLSKLILFGFIFLQKKGKISWMQVLQYQASSSLLKWS